MRYKKNSNFKQRNIVHSIPIGCILALLLLGGACINPFQPKAKTASAVTSNPTNVLLDPKISMSIYSPTDNSTMNSSAAAESGVTSYISNIVKLSMQDVASYSLQLTAAQGSSDKLINGDTTINGATGQAGTSLNANTWGYSWNNSSTADADARYYALPAYGATTTTNNGLLESNNNVSSGNVDLTKKLTFAAKFSDSAAAGHYRTTALLSLAVSPKQMTIGFGANGSYIMEMQEMTTDFCTSVPVNTTGTLRDTRDGNVYTVARLANGFGVRADCWMTQNLAIAGGTILSSNDSDLDTNVFTNISQTYAIPSSTVGEFDKGEQTDSTGAKTHANQQMRDAVIPDVNKYGAYYSWCTATAGTCLVGAYADIIPNQQHTGNTGNVSKTTALGNDVEASSSICAKGWKLPGTYTPLMQKISNSASGMATFTSTPYSFTFAGNISNPGSQAMYYYTSLSSSPLVADILSGNTSGYMSDVSDRKYNGYSVRCVAR